MEKYILANNYLKSLTAETVSNAKSGHTGSALGASTILLSLFHDHLVFDPKNPKAMNRDRFVLSAGHASALLYSLLHLFGYDITIEDLKNFRKYGSKTAGHPEYNVSVGIETTTGPLGQGVANAVGMALAQAHFADIFNNDKYRIFENKTYVYAGDGCLMEGVAMEACSLAGTLGLKNLILFYDDNNITIDGTRTLANAENVKAKFEAMNWNTIEVLDGHDYDACSKAINQAKQAQKPTIIIFKTIIGIGTSKAGTAGVHAYPLPEAELAEFKKSLQVEGEFFVPQQVYDFCNEAVERNKKVYNNYNSVLASFKAENPNKFKQLQSMFAKPKFDAGKVFESLGKEELSGRDLSGLVLNKFYEIYPFLFGGTADVYPSTKAKIVSSDFISASSYAPCNIHFGIREHAMGAIANGMSLYLHTPVFDSTFMAFSNYMIPPIRLRSMMKLPVLSVFTHDAIDIGEDGPTHQPIEQIGSLRQIIGLDVFRPATTAEMVAGFDVFACQKQPMALVVSKSKLLVGSAKDIENAKRGAYEILKPNAKPVVQIIATGTDVRLAIEVAGVLNSKNVSARVISMPSEKIFDMQDKTYKNKVLLSGVFTAVIEASSDTVWHKYVTSPDFLFNVTDYQFSGNGKEVYKKAGFDANVIADKIIKAMHAN